MKLIFHIIFIEFSFALPSNFLPVALVQRLTIKEHVVAVELCVIKGEHDDKMAVLLKQSENQDS